MSNTTRSRPSRKTMNEVPEWVDVVVKEWVSAHGESFVDYEVSLIIDTTSTKDALSLAIQEFTLVQSKKMAFTLRWKESRRKMTIQE